ncbi:MAG: DUF4348 domain-containing protein [Mediterranea sp.]|jgi:hypothetical protein|nr:DUF4348 domain-containing protein [Mediterranea sp.]
MYKKIFFSAVVFLVLFSCGNKKKEVEPVVATDVTVDSIEFVEDTILLIEPAEPAFPVTSAESFDDFIYIFASDTAFQCSRIVFPLPYYEEDTPLKIEKKDWAHDTLFVKQTYYTLLLDSEKEMEHNDDSQTSIQVEWIYMKTHKVKKYYFERVNGRWMLEAINLHPIEKDERAGFVDFFVRFAGDSLYQMKHIREPLKFVTTDPDNDFNIIETTLDTEQWFAFKPVLPGDKLSNIIYGYETIDETSCKILQLKGIGNGFLNTLFFRHKPNGKWELYKFEDTSN